MARHAFQPTTVFFEDDLGLTQGANKDFQQPFTNCHGIHQFISRAGATEGAAGRSNLEKVKTCAIDKPVSVSR